MKIKYFLNEGIHDKHIFKAIFFLGGPGSGKTFIYNNIINTGEFKLLSTDSILELDLKRKNIPLDFNKHTEKDDETVGNSIEKAVGLINKQKNNYIKGRLPIIFDITGRSFNSIVKDKKNLEDLGYECLAIYINTSPETALKNNKIRERKLRDEEYVTKTNILVRDYKNATNFSKENPEEKSYVKLFGASNFIEIVNEEKRISHQQEFKKIQAWINKPVQNSIALNWIKEQNKK